MARVGTVSLDHATRLVAGEAAPTPGLGNVPESDLLPIRTRLMEHMAAGKGIAVYRNEDLGHRHLGLCLAFTYGTPEAQFEGDVDTLFEVLPDGLAKEITGGFNWRYRLHATVR